MKLMRLAERLARLGRIIKQKGKQIVTQIA